METVGLRQSQNLDKSEQLLETVEELLSKVEKEAKKLKTGLETVKEDKKQSLKREQMLLEEKNKILSELERSKEEEEKSQIALQILASAPHQASSEASELKEKLLSLGGQDYETHVEDLKLVIKSTNEKTLYKVEQTKKQLESSMVDRGMREAGLVNHMKKFAEEVSSMVKEMNRLDVEDEVIYLQETLREARAESLKLNAIMLDKETEFQSVIHENDLLRVKQDDFLNNIKELEEALAKKHTKEDDGELSELTRL
ncbi:hypothetical protein N665_0466s0006 [Sinapis alba]|nr:hypothetical protein N665_0466s0006 [Sinapis alba]